MIHVQTLADLARMAVPSDEQTAVAKDLQTIIGFVDQVQSRDASAAASAPDTVNILRDDVVAPLGSVHDLVSAAPAHRDGFVQVPKVIG